MLRPLPFSRIDAWWEGDQDEKSQRLAPSLTPIIGPNFRSRRHSLTTHLYSQPADFLSAGERPILFPEEIEAYGVHDVNKDWFFIVLTFAGANWSGTGWPHRNSLGAKRLVRREGLEPTTR
jgi:hypothetical protein